jgi:phosphoesterase RecJ-like protein
MPLDWGPLVDIVRGHQRFLLTTHIRPDGDGLGSILAVAEILEGMGKEVQLTVASDFPSRYLFLDPQKRIGRFEPPGDSYRTSEVAVVMDTGTWNQLGNFGPFLKTLQARKVVVDHHMTQDDLGARLFVDTSSEATGRLAYEMIQALEQPLTASAASHLFVAVAMDTGWFRHSNTTPATFALAAKLVEAGARPQPLYEQLFEQSTLPRLKLTGLVLDRLTVACQGRVAHTEIRLADYLATGATPQDTEDLINYMAGLAGVEVRVFFMEQPRGGVKVSFRSRARIDVARIAERFGGGGHRLASGAVVNADLKDARAQVLEVVGAALDAAP